MSRSLRVLLDSLVDYAGLYPPASLPLEKAIENYDRYRKGEHAWALGRFVVPAAHAGEVPHDFPLALIGTVDDLAGTRGGMFEVKAATASGVEKIAAAAGGRTVYVEITDPALLQPLARHRLRAKLRTGGVTADAFPPAGTIANFIRACRDHAVPFKATAGLHHPIRCNKPLTYEADAPSGPMHGFLNVFIAAALPQFAEQILGEENPRAFAFDDGGLWWHDCRVTTEELRRLRSEVAISFGSCSFEEPISDLQELGWL